MNENSTMSFAEHALAGLIHSTEPIPDPPDDLCGLGLERWNSLIRILWHSRTVEPLNLAAFETYCYMVETIGRMRDDIETRGMILDSPTGPCAHPLIKEVEEMTADLYRDEEHIGFVEPLFRSRMQALCDAMPQVYEMPKPMRFVGGE